MQGTGTSTTHTQPALGKEKEIPMRDNVRDSASLNATQDNRRVLLYFVTHESMDHLIDLRSVIDQRSPTVPEAPATSVASISCGEVPRRRFSHCCFA
jgi:hypothetical protein